MYKMSFDMHLKRITGNLFFISVVLLCLIALNVLKAQATDISHSDEQHASDQCREDWEKLTKSGNHDLPFECDQCSASFICIDDLRSHQYNHSRYGSKTAEKYRKHVRNRPKKKESKRLLAKYQLGLLLFSLSNEKLNSEYERKVQILMKSLPESDITQDDDQTVSMLQNIYSDIIQDIKGNCSEESATDKKNIIDCMPESVLRIKKLILSLYRLDAVIIENKNSDKIKIISEQLALINDTCLLYAPCEDLFILFQQPVTEICDNFLGVFRSWKLELQKNEQFLLQKSAS